MWPKRKRRQTQQQSESMQDESSGRIEFTDEELKKVKTVKVMIYTLWLPALSILTWLIYNFLCSGIAKESKESQTGLLSSCFILLGFALNSRYNHYQLRDSKSLKPLKETIHWAIHEFSQIVVALLLITSIVLGLVNQLLSDSVIILTAFQNAAIFVVLGYAFVSFFCTNKFGVYT